MQSSFYVTFSDNLDLGTCLYNESRNVSRFCLHFVIPTLKKIAQRGQKEGNSIKSGVAGDASRENSPDSRWGSSGSCGRVFLSPSAAPSQQLPASHREAKPRNKSIWHELKL